jgi:hypothetical protein
VVIEYAVMTVVKPKPWTLWLLAAVLSGAVLFAVWPSLLDAFLILSMEGVARFAGCL